MKKDFRLEERIKPLVNALNEISYIHTMSSCEGHPERENTYGEYFPHVIFDVQPHWEKEFENLATKILVKTAPLWDRVKVEIYKRYCVLPTETSLNHNWMINFLPFDRSMPDYSKIKYYDTAIRAAVSAVHEYIPRTRH